MASLTSTTSSSVITVMKRSFARFGIPDSAVSDNGPQFSTEFASFTYGLAHQTSSLRYPQANGQADMSGRSRRFSLSRTTHTWHCRWSHQKDSVYKLKVRLEKTPRARNGDAVLCRSSNRWCHRFTGRRYCFSSQEHVGNTITFWFRGHLVCSSLSSLLGCCHTATVWSQQ